MPRMFAYVPLALFSLTGVLLLTGCPPLPSELPPPINVATGFQAEYVLAGAEYPSALAFAEDGRVFYTEKNTGRIRVINDGALLETPFAEVPVNYAGDRGLLGIALHPNFSNNGRVYVFYSRSDTGAATSDQRAVVDNRVVYFVADGDVAGGAEVFVASLPAGTDPLRVGGRLAFTDDNRLLVGLGDLVSHTYAQDNTFLHGKVLRYNDDGTLPTGNASADSPIYARGFREPRALVVDSVGGDLFVIDRSAVGLHEVNRVLAARNYGWADVTGIASTTAELAFAAANADYSDPIHQSPDRHFVGGAFNPSTKYGPASFQQLFYGVANRGRIERLELSLERTAAVRSYVFATGLPTTMTDVAFTPSGTLYVATQDAILRIVPAP